MFLFDYSLNLFTRPITYRKRHDISRKAYPGDFHFKDTTGREYCFNLFAVGPLFFISGCLSSLLGFSGGFIKMPIMLVIIGLPMHYAVANSSAMIVMTALSGFLGRSVHLDPNWGFLFISSICVFIGSSIGANFSSKVDEKKFKKLVAPVLIVFIIGLLVKHFT